MNTHIENLLEGYAPLEGLNQDMPRILSVEEFTTPSEHIRISCCFGDKAEHQFNIFLPPKEQWGGRFFQHTHPFLGLDALSEDLAFHFNSGAYSITVPPFTMGYLHQAAAAHVSRAIAKNYYGFEGKIYGYLYGGSGGSMQSIGALEATTGLVWDGIIPFITGAPVSMGNFDIRRFARAVLDEKGPLIADALRPGGSGDVDAVLNNVEREVFKEVTKLGVPLKAWENYEYLFMAYEQPDLAACLNATGEVDGGTETDEVKAETRHANVGGETDETYTKAFWNEPGYLASYTSALKDIFYSLRERGVSEGALAKISYHRHKDPGAAYRTWEHLRGADGKPLYAQTTGKHHAYTSSAMASGGALWSGKTNCKSIMVVNLMDADAFPADGHYYHERVKEMGRDKDFRIWLTENADHHTKHDNHIPALDKRLINFNGILSQALMDLCAWVETGIAPPDSTSYKMVDGQLVITENIAERGGIQPVVELTVNAAERASVTLGDALTLSAKIQVPQGTGKIINVEWDFAGDGEFVSAEFSRLPDGSWESDGNYTYNKEGVYYPQVRATSQRAGDPGASFTYIYNLGRARVIVGGGGTGKK